MDDVELVVVGPWIFRVAVLHTIVFDLDFAYVPNGLSAITRLEIDSVKYISDFICKSLWRDLKQLVL
jgi:hypothetical protein